MLPLRLNTSIAIAIAEYQAHVAAREILFWPFSRDVIWHLAVIVVLVGAFSVGVDLLRLTLMSMADFMLATTVQWLMSTELRGVSNLSMTDQNDVPL